MGFWLAHAWTFGPHLSLYSSLRITVVERVRVVRRFSAALALIRHVRAGFSRRYSPQSDYTTATSYKVAILPTKGSNFFAK